VTFRRPDVAQDARLTVLVDTSAAHAPHSEVQADVRLAGRSLMMLEDVRHKRDQERDADIVGGTAGAPLFAGQFDRPGASRRDRSPVVSSSGSDIGAATPPVARRRDSGRK
jgi:hypothetical protein